MDKETLSHYGWIVILVLILSVLLAFASPFGTFIADGFKAAYTGFDMVGNNAMDVVMNATGGCTHRETEVTNVTADYSGDTVCKKCGAVLENGKYVIPTGNTYYDKSENKYLSAGENFPDECGTGDIYYTADYMYRYNQHLRQDTTIMGQDSLWITDESQNGWGVAYLKNFAVPAEMLCEVNGEPITSLAYTFNSRTAITTSPTIPNTVIDMAYTFKGCTSLINIPDIPSNVIYLNSTFSYCTALKDASSLNIPNSVTTVDSMFYNCTSLVDSGVPKIPDNITKMSGTFQNCTSLVNLSNFKIPENTKEMYQTFKGCTSLEILPNFENATNVTSLQWTFVDCTSLVDISYFIIPSKVTQPYQTFKGCTSLTDDGLPVLPNTVTEVYGIFEGCTSLVDLSEYKLPSSLTDITSMFAFCTSLEKIPDLTQCPNLKEMSTTFYNCTSLKTFSVIPAKVYDLRSTFRGCTSLTGTIQYDGHTNGSWLANCFAGTVEQITIIGSTSTSCKAELAATAENGNVTY